MTTDRPEPPADRSLDEADLLPCPFDQFQRWFDEAKAAGQVQPEAMCLATTTPDGRPSARMVLLRGLDRRGFAFFTNYDSRKARELSENPRAALVFYWGTLDRQVRVEGRVELTSAAESDAYFASRPRGSQLGAWASPQSEVMPNRQVLEARLREIAARFAAGPVPRPPRWGGFRVVPETIEFWQDRPNRLHDRLMYVRQPDGGWIVQRLAP
jgi:pyridoxamine 5'-phosphate oxidase